MESQSAYYHLPFKAMGSPCHIRLYGASRKRAKRIAKLAMEEVLRLEQKYSRYRDETLISRINRSAGSGRSCSVDDETAALLDYADTCFTQSGGLFDITSGALRQVWDFKGQHLPNQQAIDALLPTIGWQKVVWDREALTIELPLNAMEIDFGGVVKEYAADSAATICRNHGVLGGLVDLGGDIQIIGPHPNAKPWQVGIRDPQIPDKPLSIIGLESGGIASSGDYERFMVVDGIRYSHLLNPNSGWPVQGLSSVSVLAPQTLVAGSATTIAMLKPQQQALEWLAELGVPYLAVDRDNQIYGTIASQPPPM